MYFMNFKYAIDKAEGMVADIKPFKYKEINFDIETNGITEEELVNLLESIIK